MFQPELETMGRERLEALQLERLRTQLARVYVNVPLYRRKFDEAGFRPEQVETLADLARVPFTVKDDLRSAYPFGMFAVPLRDIVRVHSSSGTTGQVSVVGYTRGDVERWSDLMARTLACAGATADDVVQVAYGYGLFTGGLGAHYGSERLGAMTIPVSGGNTARQVQILKDFGVTVLACTPSYALLIAETAASMGIDVKSLPLRVGVFGAEPWSEAMRDQIEDAMGITAIDIYGLSEVMGPGVSIECEEKNGLHIFEDAFLAETIDPAAGERLPFGEQGELVFTTINKFGMPLIRYRTRDVTTLDDTQCPCGRTHVRMKRVSGRSDDMLIIRGVNVFPSQIETVLMQIEGISPHYQIIVERVGGLDMLEVEVEVSEEMFSDRIKALEELQQVITDEIESYLGIGVKVKLMEPRSIARSEGKAVRVKDNREI